MSTFSNRLKTLRKYNSISQKNLASILGISENSYQRYEYATREPDLSTVKKIADYFNISVDFLLGRGVFENWDVISSQQSEISNAVKDLFFSLEEEFPKNLDTMELIRILPALFKKIEFDKDSNSLMLYPLFDIKNSK